MYIGNSIIDGLKILGFDKETIKKVSREKSLEEIFLSTLFLNYIIVLVIFMITVILGGNIQLNNKDLNMSVFFGLLMIYPFAYNVIIYMVYGLFGFMSELLNSTKKIKPLVSVGFHTAIVYTLVFYIIGLITTFDYVYGLFLFALFVVYFLLTMFLSLMTIYNFSTQQALMVLIIPLLICVGALLLLIMFVDLKTIISFFLT
ncbi:MAG: hypothetical protein ACOC16_00185 [Nanoarchaeota archaeon]